MEEDMINLFEEVQISKRSHKSLVKKLNNSYLKQFDIKTNPKPMNILLNCVLDQTLLHVKNNSNIQRLIAFFGLAITSFDDQVKAICFQHLFKRLKSTLKHVRQRVCQLIEEFLRSLSELGIEIDCNLLSELSLNLLTRLRDKVPTVRAAAVNALIHLQDPNDKNDSVIGGLLELLRIESAVTVRNAVVKVISLCEITKDVLVHRLRDVSADVRVSVLNRFLEDSDIRQFSRASRIDIVQTTLFDRQPSVRSIGEKLLLNWLKLLNQDVHKFLTCFGPLENEKTALLVAAWLAEKTSTDKSDDFDDVRQSSSSWNATLSDIAPAEIIWTVVRCQYAEQFMSKFVAVQLFHRILPPLEFFLTTFRDSQTITALDRSRIFQFNLKYLIQLIPFFSLAQHQSDDNEGTVRILEDLENFIFKNSKIPFDVYQILLDELWKIGYVKKSKFMQNIIIQFRQQMALDSSDEEERNNISCRILLIVKSILQHQSCYQRTEMMEFFAFVLNCLQQPVASLRAFATSCLSIYSIFDVNVRKQYLPVIKQVAVGEFEDELVQIEALKGLVDVCLVAEIEEFSNQDRVEIDATLLRQMQRNDENAYDDLSFLAMESVVKLVFHGFSKDPALVTKLLHFFFVEGSDAKFTSTSFSSTDLIRMNQLLSIFLHSFLVNEETCFEIVRQSLPLFISDCVLAMKDERMEANALGNIMENLLGICRQVLIAIQSSGKQNVLLTESYQFLSKTAFSCLCCEFLKLGNDKTAKIMKKDFIRQLHNIELAWCSKNEITSVSAVLQAIKTSSVDKTSEKLLAELIASVEDCKVTSISRNLTFMDCAPALRELAQITNNYWEESVVIGTKRSRTTTRKLIETVKEESSDDEDESLDSDDYTEDSSDGEGNEEPLILQNDTENQAHSNETNLDDSMYFEEI